MARAAGQATAVLRGYNGVQLTPAAEKQLTSYEFPANEAELQGLVQRAIMLHPPAPPATSALPAAAKAKEEGSLAGGFEFLRMGTNQGSAQAAGGHVLVLESGDFWAATGTADRERVDVLEVMPWLRKCILDTGQCIGSVPACVQGALLFRCAYLCTIPDMCMLYGPAHVLVYVDQFSFKTFC
jgi:hypothetical protein